MPAKTTKTTKVKSNVARPTGKAATLNKKVKFNWKIAVVIGVVLIAGLGYLYVRLSKAGGFVWTPDRMRVIAGERVVKNDGTPAIQTKFRDAGAIFRNDLIAEVDSSLPTRETYCVNGNNLGKGETTVSFSGWKPPGVTSFSGNPIQAPAGKFRICQSIPGTYESRKIQVSVVANGEGNAAAIYSLERVDSTATAPGTKTGTTSQSPAPGTTSQSPAPGTK